jgi:hypothetical protein
MKVTELLGIVGKILRIGNVNPTRATSTTFLQFGVRISGTPENQVVIKVIKDSSKKNKRKALLNVRCNLHNLSTIRRPDIQTCIENQRVADLSKKPVQENKKSKPPEPRTFGAGGFFMLKT